MRARVRRERGFQRGRVRDVRHDRDDAARGVRGERERSRRLESVAGDVHEGQAGRAGLGEAHGQTAADALGEGWGAGGEGRGVRPRVRDGSSFATTRP